MQLEFWSFLQRLGNIKLIAEMETKLTKINFGAHQILSDKMFTFYMPNITVLLIFRALLRIPVYNRFLLNSLINREPGAKLTYPVIWLFIYKQYMTTQTKL